MRIKKAITNKIRNLLKYLIIFLEINAKKISKFYLKNNLFKIIYKKMRL